MSTLVLVVENDHATRVLLEAVVARAGATADSVDNGASSLLLLEQIEYAAIILDLRLPRVGGRDVLTWLQEHRPDLLSRLIVISSETPAVLDELRQRYEPGSVLMKPFEITTLLQFVEAALSAALPQPLSFEAELRRQSVKHGAKLGIVVSPSDDGMLRVIFNYGAKPEQLEQFEAMPPDAQFPICQAYQTAMPVWLQSLGMATADYPLLVPVWEANHSYALAALPLVVDGQTVGAIGWTFYDTQNFDADAQKSFMAIAELASQELVARRQSRAG